MRVNEKQEVLRSLVVENLHAPEVFASDAPNFSIGNGVVTVVLASLRFDNTTNPAEKRLVTVGRVVMPIASARALASGLHAFLEQHGISAVPAEDRKHMQ